MNAGDLATSGRELTFKSFAGGFEVWNTTSALATNGLLDNGATLWFSYLVERDNAGWASGEWSGFMLGSVQGDSSANGPKLTAAGEAIGVQVNKNSPYKPAAWVGTGDGASSVGSTGINAAGNGVTQLIVGKIEWGTAGADETLTLYSPALNDLQNLGTGVSTTFADMTQSAFDTITIAQREAGDNVYYDEIRFGATYLEVIGLPEPAGDDFASWTGGFSLTDTTFDGDDDGDSLGNGIEGFFGTAPDVWNAGLAEVSKSTNTVTFTHPNPDAADVLTDVIGSYEWSLDLNTWYKDDGSEGPGATTVTTAATPDSPTANTTTVVATIGGDVPVKIFVRVVATQN
jgi:hypothetical protein